VAAEIVEIPFPDERQNNGDHDEGEYYRTHTGLLLLKKNRKTADGYLGGRIPPR
jgi:hypothetical protein